VTLEDRLLTFTINLPLRDEDYNRAMEGLRSLMIYLRSDAEMINNQTKIFELADATKKYLDEKGHFPRGTLVKTDSPDLILPVPPQKRLSWMVDLLPYVGGGEYKDLLMKADKSWQEGDNLVLAQLVIPQFLVRGLKDNAAYRVRYPGLSRPVAATHFVGISGVGMDSPYYDMKNPAEAKKVGIFGYDRETKREDVKDGLDKTILLIQVPLDHKSPWIAGGGSTVRGVSEELDCFKPFICTEYDGKKGTFAIMADGKVRFIPETISPENFRALWTIAGGEPIANVEAIAQEVKPGQALSELRSLPTAPSTKPNDPTPMPKTGPTGPSDPPSPTPTPNIGKGDDPLQGVWVGQTMEADGMAAPSEAVKRMRFTFKDGKLLVRGNFDDDREEDCTYRIDPKQSPKHLDFTTPTEKKPVLAIYDVNGNELKVCLRHASSSDGRPTAFATKAGSKLVLIVFKKEKS